MFVVWIWSYLNEIVFSACIVVLFVAYNFCSCSLVITIADSFRTKI